jgi:hypothetical protein
VPPRVRTLGAAPLCYKGIFWSFPIRKIGTVFRNFELQIIILIVRASLWIVSRVGKV